MLARVALVAVAAVLAVVAVGRAQDERRCRPAAEALRTLGFQRPGAVDVPAALRDVRAACRGGGDLVGAAGGLLFVGRTRQGTDLAREAVRREPDAFASWAILDAALRRSGDQRGAARAEARAQALNPRWQGPARRP